MFTNELWNKPPAGATGIYPYQIANSLRLNGTSQALEKTWGSAASDDNKKALSFWIKRTGASNTNSAIGSTTNTKLVSTNNFSQLEMNTGNPAGTSDQFHVHWSSNKNVLLAKWRDVSAWMHIVWIWNSDESTAVDRLKTYINGVKQTIDTTYWNIVSGNGYPNSGQASEYGKNGNEMHIARYQYDDAGWWGGQMADWIMIDGAASISDFGETHNGVWRPKDPSGLTFGNNGFWLKFTNASNPGEDFSGNDNDFTNIGSIATHDQMLDSPTFNSDSNGGNFSTFNAVYRGDQSDDQHYGALTEGNLKMSFVSNGDCYRPATIKTPASGKWYFEYLINAGGGSTGYSPAMGIINPDVYTYANRGSDGSVGSIVYGNHQNKVYKDESVTGTYGGTRGSNGDVMGIAVDMDNGAFYVSKNGTFQTISGGSQGDPTSGASRTGAGATWTPANDYKSGMVALGAPTGGSVPIITANFGQEGTFAGEKTAGGNSDTNGYGNFFSAVPSGYSAICSGALSVADAVDPAQTDDNFPQKLFNPLTYTASGGDSYTGLGFQPDWVWVKWRGGSQSHGLFDSNRGTTKVLNSDANNAEATSSGLTAFGTDGYTMGEYYNQNAREYVSWNWRANGGTTSSNSNGSITSTVQADPSGGFSVVTWTGAAGSWGTLGTVGHGLNATPTVILAKIRSGTGEWCCFFSDYGNYSIGGSNAASNKLQLDKNDALYTNQSYADFGKVMPTSTVFTVNGNLINNSGSTVVAYCFTNIEGYIKSGIYYSNTEATDNAFVYLGFRPALLLIKAVGSGHWQLIDNKRNGFNPQPESLDADRGNASRTNATDFADLLANGFKVRTDNQVLGEAAQNPYVYLAMAENPFKYATAR